MKWFRQVRDYLINAIKDQFCHTICIPVAVTVGVLSLYVRGDVSVEGNKTLPYDNPSNLKTAAKHIPWRLFTTYTDTLLKGFTVSLQSVYSRRISVIHISSCTQTTNIPVHYPV